MPILIFSEIIIKEKKIFKIFSIDNFITKYIYKNMNGGGLIFLHQSVDLSFC